MASNTAEQIGKRIRAMRQSQGLSLKELSQRSGFAVSSLQNYETGFRQPSFDALKTLAATLKCSAAWLSTLADSYDILSQGDYYLVTPYTPGEDGLASDSVMFSQAHLEAAGSNSASVLLHKAKDNLLSPDVNLGDEVLIDRTDKNPSNTAAIYCLEDEMGNRVVRWGRRELGKKGCTYYANDSKHFPELFVADNNSSINVVGRVLCVVRWL